MVGKVIGNYQISEKIGEGGMGDVYKGMDIMLERTVAIKTLRSELIDDSDIVERFRREARALAKLNHPNITNVYNFFTHEGEYLIVLEYVNGENLEQRLQRERKFLTKMPTGYLLKSRARFRLLIIKELFTATSNRPTLWKPPTGQSKLPISASLAF